MDDLRKLTVFVINLDRSIERRQLMTQRLAKISLRPDFVQAIDGKSYTTDRPDMLTILTAGEVGCYLSHLKAWQTIVDRDLPVALVLEDDVQLSEDITHVLRVLTAWAHRYDMVRLSRLRKPVGVRVADVASSHHLLLPRSNSSGLQGSLVSQAGARRLLDHLGGVMKMPIDTCLYRSEPFGLNAPVLCPPVVFEDNQQPSTIGVRFGAWKMPRKSLWVRLQRSWARRQELRRLKRAWANSAGS